MNVGSTAIVLAAATVMSAGIAATNAGAQVRPWIPTGDGAYMWSGVGLSAHPLMNTELASDGAEGLLLMQMSPGFTIGTRIEPASPVKEAGLRSDGELVQASSGGAKEVFVRTKPHVAPDGSGVQQFLIGARVEAVQVNESDFEFLIASRVPVAALNAYVELKLNGSDVGVFDFDAFPKSACPVWSQEGGPDFKEMCLRTLCITAGVGCPGYPDPHAMIPERDDEVIVAFLFDSPLEAERPDGTGGFIRFDEIRFVASPGPGEPPAEAIHELELRFIPGREPEARALDPVHLSGFQLSLSCPGDFDGDGAVGASDLATVLGEWGSPHPVADIDGDGLVGAGDLAEILGRWGPCP
ncbi:MAG: hypothetical protein EA376_05185 [Phycisphaeraceae bacterium]|nr:MAG: hypothetical protein EA376_05185 [Phycisphaeraceae bacterium]